MPVPATQGNSCQPKVTSLITREGHLVIASSAGLPEHIYLSALWILSWCVIICVSVSSPIRMCVLLGQRPELRHDLWSIFSAQLTHQQCLHTKLMYEQKSFIHHPLSVANFHDITLPLVQPITDVRVFRMVQLCYECQVWLMKQDKESPTFIPLPLPQSPLASHPFSALAVIQNWLWTRKTPLIL